MTSRHATQQNPWLGETIRRVVIHERADGKSAVANDEHVAGTSFDGTGVINTLWGMDGMATFPDDGQKPFVTGLYPPPGGHRIHISRFSAGSTVKPADGDNLVNTGRDGSHAVPGMHKSDTADFDIILAGEIDCVLSDGTKLTFRAGEVVVMNGADHAWQNNGTEDAVVAFVMIGSARR